MSVRCLLLFPRGDYYGGPDHREMPPVEFEVAPRVDECVALDDNGDEWYVDRVAHAPNSEGAARVWLFLRIHRYRT